MYLLSFPRFWTLSIERFRFVFWSILNGVTQNQQYLNALKIISLAAYASETNKGLGGVLSLAGSQNLVLVILI